MKMQIVTLAAVAVLGLSSGVSQAQMYGDEYRDKSAFGRMQTKLGRGLANTFTGMVEVPKQISREWRRTDPATGIIIGGVKGVGWGLTRVATGMYETVTFVAPTPANYEPLLYPATPLPDVWGEQLPYFDRDGDPRLTL